MAINMDLWGVQDTGFYRPTIEDINEAKNEQAKLIFGDDFDMSEDTPEGMFFRVNTAAENKLLEIAEDIYYSIFPHTATGLSLDWLCQFANLRRDVASFAVHVIRVYGTENYIVEAGTEFKSSNGVEFYSVANATINNELDVGGTKEYYADVTVQCKERGTVGNVPTINSTVEVNNSIEKVQWLSIEAYGTTTESDFELRDKFNIAIQGMGSSNAPAIRANVVRVPQVNNCTIMDNTTTEDVYVSDNLTIAAGTYAVIVHSDSMENQEEIAKAVFEKQPLGIHQSGKESVEVVDESGLGHTVKFTYVEPKPIKIDIACTVDSTFPTGGEHEISAYLSLYIDELDIGEEVVYTKLYDCIYGVQGVKKVTSMTINDGTEDIPINQIEKAKVGTVNVTITEG